MGVFPLSELDFLQNQLLASLEILLPPQQTCGDKVARKDFVSSNAAFLIASSYGCGARLRSWSAWREGRCFKREGCETQERQGGTGLCLPPIACYNQTQVCGWTLLLFAWTVMSAWDLSEAFFTDSIWSQWGTSHVYKPSPKSLLSAWFNLGKILYSFIKQASYQDVLHRHIWGAEHQIF